MNLLLRFESGGSTYVKGKKHHHITSQRHYAAFCDSYTVGIIALPTNTRFLAIGTIVMVRSSKRDKLINPNPNPDT